MSVKYHNVFYSIITAIFENMIFAPKMDHRVFFCTEKGVSVEGGFNMV